MYNGRSTDAKGKKANKEKLNKIWEQVTYACTLDYNLMMRL